MYICESWCLLEETQAFVFCRTKKITYFQAPGLLPPPPHPLIAPISSAVFWWKGVFVFYSLPPPHFSPPSSLSVNPALIKAAVAPPLRYHVGVGINTQSLLWQKLPRGEGRVAGGDPVTATLHPPTHPAWPVSPPLGLFQPQHDCSNRGMQPFINEPVIIAPMK